MVACAAACTDLIGGVHIARYVDRPTLGPQFSPSMSPSTKAVLDDITGISLDGGRSERADSRASQSDKNSEHVEPVVVSVGTPKTPPAPGAVLVTTTIQRESKPNSNLFNEMNIEDEYMGRIGRPRPISGALALAGDSFMRTNRIKISAGPHH